MAEFYIIIVHAAILSDSVMPFGAVVITTLVVAFFGSLMMEFYTKNPIAVAQGMGINAFFTYSTVTHYDLSYQEELGTVSWSGVVFMFLSSFITGEKTIQSMAEV